MPDRVCLHDGFEQRVVQTCFFALVINVQFTMATICKSEQTLMLTKEDLERFKRMSVEQIGWAVLSMMQIRLEGNSSIYEKAPYGKRFWSCVDGVLMRNSANNY